METEASKLQRPRVTAGPAVTPGGLQSGPGAGGSPRESPPERQRPGRNGASEGFLEGRGPPNPRGEATPAISSWAQESRPLGDARPAPRPPGALSWRHVTRPRPGRGGPHAATSSRRATAGPTEGDQRRDGCAASGSGRWRRRLLGISRAACWPRSPSRPHPTGGAGERAARGALSASPALRRRALPQASPSEARRRGPQPTPGPAPAALGAVGGLPSLRPPGVWLFRNPTPLPNRPRRGPCPSDPGSSGGGGAGCAPRG